MNNILKVLQIVNNNKKILLLTTLFIFSSIIDLIGLGLLIPYVNLILNPINIYNKFPFLENLSFFSENIILNLSILILLIFCSKFIFSLLINYLIYQNSQKLIHKLRMQLMNSFQQIDYFTYLKKNSSYYIECLTTWSHKFGNNILVSLLKILNESFNFLVIIIFLSLYNFKLLVLILSFLLVLVFLYSYFFRNILQKYGKIVNVTNEKITQLINESFIGFKDIRIYKKENLFFNWIKKNSLYSIRNTIKALMITNSNRYFFELLAVIFFVSLVILSFFNNSLIKLEISGILIFGYGLLRLMPISNSLLGSYLRIKQDSYVIEKVFNEIKASKKNKLKKNKLKKNNYLKNEENFQKFENILLKNVNYKYNKKNSVTLSNINFNIKKGEKVAIVGKSGAGKTTLLNIILGLLEPQNGQIKYNGKEVNNMLSIMNKISGYVPQEVFILDESIEKNITLDDNITKNDRKNILRILKKVNLYELFKNKDRSVRSKLGQSGIRISGGQRQRLALARALYNKKELIIFDEATSSLDIQTEKEIYNELSRLNNQEYTFIVITHRKENLKFFNKIIYLNRGKIEKIEKIEKGSI